MAYTLCTKLENKYVPLKCIGLMITIINIYSIEISILISIVCTQ